MARIVRRLDEADFQHSILDAEPGENDGLYSIVLVDQPLSQVGRQFDIQRKITHCSAKLLAVTYVLKDDDVEHLIESVSDSGTILRANLRLSEIRGDEGEELAVIPILEQLNGGVDYRAIVQHLRGLFAQVIDAHGAQRAHGFEFVEILGSVDNIADIKDFCFRAESPSGFRVIEELEVVVLVEPADGTKERSHHGGLAIAAAAAEQDAELRILGGDIFGKLRQVGGGVHIEGWDTCAAFDLVGIESGQEVERTLRRHIEPKTTLRNRLPCDCRHQFPDGLHVYFQICFHC